MAYFQLFYKLDELTLRKWDEGKNAVSAYEMLHNNNFLVRYYEGKPDDWGFKPPLLTWHQVLSMKVFGVNEFAVRFPSALYAYFTALLIFFFFKDELKFPYAGLLASFVLLTSVGYLERHIAKTGDHDSMLTFFLTLQALSFYKYLRYNRQTKYLLLFTFSLILASLTKGIAGLFLIPGFILYAAFDKKFLQIISDHRVYLCLLLFVFVIGGYYGLREADSPGYLKSVWENELLPRYIDQSEAESYAKHHKDYFYYVKNLWNKRLKPWAYILPLFLIALFFTCNKKIKSIYFYLLLVGLTYLVIISAGTKNLWYDAPLYPIIAIIIAAGTWQLFTFIDRLPINQLTRFSTTLAILIPIIYFPINNSKKLTFQVKEKPWQYDEQGINYFLRSKIENSEKINDLGIAYSGYHSHIRFYMNQLNDMGSHIYFTNYKKLKTPSIIIASEKENIEYIEQHYLFTKEVVAPNTAIYKIEHSLDDQ